MTFTKKHLRKKRIYARCESRFTRSPHCYVTWCPLTTGIVASQYPSPRDAVLVRRCVTPLISACLNTAKVILPQQNIFTTNVRTWMKVLTLLLTVIIGGIFHKQCQWLAWRVWWHVLAFVTHEITWRRAYVIGIDTKIEVIVVSPTTWEAHHSPRAKPEGCGELPRSLVTPQWPKSRYQFRFYHDAPKYIKFMQIRVCISRKSFIKPLQISHYGKHGHRPLSQQLP